MQIWWVAHKAQPQEYQYGNTLDSRRYLRCGLICPKKDVPLSRVLGKNLVRLRALVMHLVASCINRYLLMAVRLNLSIARQIYMGGCEL
jgi:hypothetical protein